LEGEIAHFSNLRAEMNARWRTIGFLALRLIAAGWILGLSAACLAAEPAAPSNGAAAPEPAEKKIQQLIAQLGDKEYCVRQRAQDELVKLGFSAFEALNAASNHADFEIASRARYLLRLIRSQWAGDKDPPEARKLLEGYELLDVDERTRRIRGLIRLPNCGGIPVVCRLICYEKSEMLASLAALEILQHEPMDQATRTRLAQLLREHLDGKQRRPAQWLMTYVALRDNPGAVLETWSKLADEEQKFFRATPERTVCGAAAMLTYLLADAQVRLGQQSKADETAQRARQLGGNNEPAQLQARLQTAYALRRRGLFSWAEGEYRHVAEVAPIIQRVLALMYHSEMLHDRGESLSAANVRGKAVEAINQLARQEQDRVRDILGSGDIEVADIAARMNYFLACHWQQQGDRAKQRQCLDDAIRASSTEVDTLIALAKLPDQTEAEREKTRRLIDKTVLVLRRDIDESPDDANAYNQVAWLMGNTQKDLDEALRLAKKATELSPDNGAYLDTLAHVYFAKGDLDNAIRFQTRAAEVEPHSGQIVSELKAFRAAAEERKKGREVSRPGK
jgi:tetratricopeptide (TPR) repeat protein